MMNMRHDILSKLLICLLYSLNPWKFGVHASYISVTTSLQYNYLLSDFQASSFSDAESQCVSQGTVMATYDNTQLQDIIDFLAANSPTYDSYQIWIPITKSGSQFYLTGSSEELNGDKWYPGEPNYSCGSGICCYRLAYYGSLHMLRDNPCSYDYNFLCVDNTVTTAATTTTTIVTTSTNIETTSTTPETTSNTAGAASTTVEITSTTAATILTTVAATSTTAASSATTIYTVALSTGEQMSLLFIGFIVGGSLFISCFCSTLWLVINRIRKSKREKKEGNENWPRDEQTGVESIDSSDNE